MSSVSSTGSPATGRSGNPAGSNADPGDSAGGPAGGPATTEAPADLARLSFEDALAELEVIVRTLEGGQAGLEDAIRTYERGALLKAHCERKLRDAQEKVDVISRTLDGDPTVRPFDGE